jgi:hypothetical protein
MDCRLAALWHGEFAPDRQWKGEIRVWDTNEGRLLFSISHSETSAPGAYGPGSLAFTPESDKLVAFGWGYVKYYKVPSGELIEPDAKHEFPRDEKRRRVSQLIGDAQGNLFVVVGELQKQTISIRELSSGREVISWASSGGPTVFPGVILVIDSKGRIELRDIPTGKLRCESAVRGLGGDRGHFACTPDGRIMIQIGSKTRVWIDGAETASHVELNGFSAVSPDGRLATARVHPLQSYPVWLNTILDGIGFRAHEPYQAIYDFATGQELARLPHAGVAYFSLDGRTLALATDDSLLLYDLPLRKPWGKVVGLALGCACVVFLAGQWFRWRRKARTKAEPQAPLHIVQEG